MLELARQVNWVDLFILILFIRIGYVATKSGFPGELFKFFGTLVAIYLSLHYYSGLAIYAREKLGFAPDRLAFLDFFAFLSLAVLGYFIFMLLRLLFYRLIKMEAVPSLDRWGGIILGMLRGVLLISLLMFTFAVSNIVYLKKSVAGSYLGKVFFQVAPLSYAGMWNGFVSKFRSAENFNENVVDLQEELTKE